MKVALALLAFVALSAASPQPRKIFHEHFEDFLDLIIQEADDDLDHILEHYMEFDEFLAAMDYVRTTNFRDLIYEMEELPEFKAVVQFLEEDNIDILYFIDRFNEMIAEIQRVRRSARHGVSGTDLSSFIKDSIALFPKEKLAALFEQKKEEDPEFKLAMDNLQSDEWDSIFDALWENEVFQKEVQTLNENGIDVDMILEEIVAIFGQN